MAKHMVRVDYKSFVSLAVWFCLSAPAMAGTIRHDVPDSQYIELGSEPDYESVGFLRWIEAGSAESATGILISPNWVLAAAHTIDGAESISFEIGTEVYDADEWLPHPDWTNSDSDLSLKLLEGTDIGLIRLSRPIGDVTPAELYSGSSEVQSTTTIVGFGGTGTGLTGALDFDLDRRAGTNVFDFAFGLEEDAPEQRILGVDFDNPVCETNPATNACEPPPVGRNASGSAVPLAQEFLPVFGDSGGGAFLDVDGEAQLAGIVSFFGNGGAGLADGDYGDTAGLTRVSKFVDWIHSEIGTGVAGDFDQDGFLTENDIDALTAQILDNEAYDAQFDLNSDAIVSSEDRRIWVEELKGTFFGDANLDNNVTSSDLNAMALNWQESERTWAGGDFDGSGFVDSNDLNLLGLNWQAESPASAPVPEPVPAMGIWVAMGILYWRFLYRRLG